MTKSVEKKLKNYLILNKYLLSLFGFKSFRDVQKALANKQEGLSLDKKFYFTEALQSEKISKSFRQDLELYDEHIQEYLNYINKSRQVPVELKYFQYFAVLLTEIYLDKYFNHFDSFYQDLAEFTARLNKKENKRGKNSYPYPNMNEMRKLAIWAATGSGKTLIMHINMLQIKRYYKGKYDNYLLITPNEALSRQHITEMNMSGIRNDIFSKNMHIDDWTHNDPPILVIEITKFKEAKDITGNEGKSVDIAAFGRQNIIFVDEGHKGQASKEAKVWIKHRKDLVKKGGFTFEYSATFEEITGKDEVFNEYASSIIIDYTYKYFYEDGYGKDYSILNLQNPEDYGEKYLTFALLSYYEQKKYYELKHDLIKPFNISEPLMVFVGTYVTGTGKKENNTDVETVCKFLAEFVNKKEYFSPIIEKILSDKSGLLDKKGTPITLSKLPFLKDYVKKYRIKPQDLYDQILSDLFYVKSAMKMEFIELGKADGEIGIRFGTKFCGLINIGDPGSFLKIIKEDKDKKGYPYFKVGPKSEFQDSLFDVIDKKDSSINFLIGSKKFIEGWNSYRVSSMCLLNIGKKKGALVIQLFGRGVRLRGYKGMLKRSSYLIKEEIIDPDEIAVPEHLSLLETLNIFGIKASYMEDFRENLEESGIVEYEKYKLTIKPNFPSTALYLPRLVKNSFSFVDEVAIIGLDHNISKTIIDLSSKVETLESKTDLMTRDLDLGYKIKEHTLDRSIIELLDLNQIYLELLKYKEIKGYANLYFTKEDIKTVLYNKDGAFYSFICDKRLLILSEDDEITKLNRIQEYSVQMLKKVMDKIYKRHKFEWQKANLEYEPI
ncbi:MAG: DEAD/DEAH box helicase family protein, partial [Promethearchaeota archaeon]